MSRISSSDHIPRPTMRDVAALAGVSLKTVSRVINGETTVAEDLASRVRRAAERLDYRPNLAASSLRRSDGKTRTIGLLLENVANPFSAALYRAIEDVARARDVSVLAASVDEDPRRERHLVSDLVARRVDGLIVAPCGDDQSYLLTERRSGLSMVFVDRRPRLLDADSVVSDNIGGAATAVMHLITNGHRRIAYLGDLHTIATARERYQGYLDAHRASGLVPGSDFVRYELHSIAEAEDAATELLGARIRPTALFTSQNLVTLGAWRALQRLGLGTAVALVGFDDFPLADLLQPAITVVAQDPPALGRLAAEVLFRRMEGDTSPTAVHVLATTLIVRGSGECPPVGRGRAPRAAAAMTAATTMRRPSVR